MKKLPIRLQIIYALGQFGWSILSGIVATYLVYYYIPTSSSGIHVFIPQIAVFGFLTIIGMITMAGRLFDAVTDPWIATLSDRSHARSGRRISFLRMSAIPFAVLTVLVFYNPVAKESGLNAGFLVVTLLLYYLFLTLYVTPFFALLSELGKTPKERLNLSTYISLTWFLGFAVASQAAFVWNIFVNNGMEKEQAMRLAFMLLALLALIFMLLPAFLIDEKTYCDSQPSELNMMDSIKATFHNREFTKFVLSDFAYWIAITTFQTALIYYMTVLLGQKEEVNGLVMVYLGVASFLLYAPVNILAKKLGKKRLLIVGFTLFVSVYFFSFFLGSIPLTDQIQIGILILLAAFPMAIFGILPNAVIADLAEYSTRKTGIRREGMFFGTRTFVSKLGQMVSMLVVTSLLLINTNGTNELGIRLTTLSAGIFCLAGMILLFFYNEKKILHEIGEEGGFDA